jgi:SulP family sulfate permease
MTDSTGTARATLLPGLAALRTYDRTWLMPDVIAGATVWALLIPQGLAYAGLGGVDPVVGLYTAIGAMIAYFLFGGVRHLNVGPEATIALVSASVVAPLAAGDPGRVGAQSVLLAFLAGLVLIAGWLIRIGWLSRLLSQPLLLGYLAGTAITMIIGQLDDILGIKLVAQDDPVAELREILGRLDEANRATLAIGISVIALVLVLRRVAPRVPAYLVAVAVSVAASILFDFAARGIPVVGEITGGLPSLGLPVMGTHEVLNLLGPAIAVGVLAFADSGITSKVLSKRTGEPFDPDQELLALGAANIGSSLLGGIAVNGSGSRSFTALASGARSRVFGLVLVVLVVLTLAFLTPLIEPLPKATLGAIIIVVAAGLIDIPGFRVLWRLDRVEFALAMLAVVAVLWLGVISGIVVVVLLSLLLVAKEAALPATSQLVEVPGTGTFRSRDTFPEAPSIAGLVVYRLDGPLFFANVDLLRRGIHDAVAAADPPAREVLFDAEAVYDIDSTAVMGLLELIDELAEAGVRFTLARLKSDTYDFLVRAGVIERVGADAVFLQVSDGAAAFRARTDPSEQG